MVKVKDVIVRLDGELARKVKVRAALEGSSIKAVLTAAAKLYLAQPVSKGGTA